MTTLSSIAQRIYSTLKSVTALKGKVFPIVANEGTTYPFVTFERISFGTEATKDGNINGEITYTVNVVTSAYFEGLELCDSIIEAVLRMPERPTLTSAAETYDQNGYVQSLTFSFF